MIEVNADIWDYKEGIDTGTHLLCIPTNGMLTADGKAVMGAGVAKQVLDRYPSVDRTLGDYLKTRGTPFTGLIKSNTHPEFFSLATKTDWRSASDPNLVRWSINVLYKVIRLSHTYREDKIILLPRPGCGHGGLSYEDEVKAMVINLPENVWVINKEEIEDGGLQEITKESETNSDAERRTDDTESLLPSAECTEDEADIEESN